MEDIKTVSNDFGKSTESNTPEIKVGKRTIINGVVYSWNGENYIPVNDVSKKTRKKKK